MRTTLALVIVSLVLSGNASGGDPDSSLTARLDSERGLRLGLSIPYVNSFMVNKQSGSGSGAGFFGIACELDVPLAVERSVSTQVGGAMDFPLPILAAIDYPGEHELYTTVFINVRYNVLHDPLSYGIGLHASILQWTYWGKEVEFNAKRINRGLGISAMVQYQLLESLAARVNYQPMVFSSGVTLFSGYQHFLSLEAMFAFDL